MKTNIYRNMIVILAIFMTSTRIIAQDLTMLKDSDVAGIYITLDDYMHNRLTIPTDRKHEGDDIQLKQFFISPEILTIEDGNKTVYFKDSVFAIKLTNGENYRFINRTPYQIIDTSCLYIYEHNTMKMVIKSVGPHRRIKEVPVSYYYFSLKQESQPQPLTLQNLKYLSVSREFDRKLQAIFGKDESADKSKIAALNSLLNTYGIKQ